jgi:hypothetical protein
MKILTKGNHSYVHLLFIDDITVSGLEGGPGVGPGGEDLITLEAEITELQRENARVESQMLKLRTDITAMEAHLRHGDKVSIGLKLLSSSFIFKFLI